MAASHILAHWGKGGPIFETLGLGNRPHHILQRLIQFSGKAIGFASRAQVPITTATSDDAALKVDDWLRLGLDALLRQRR